MAMLQAKTSLTVRRREALSPAPMYLPLIASPAYAKPSVK